MPTNIRLPDLPGGRYLVGPAGMAPAERISAPQTCSIARVRNGWSGPHFCGWCFASAGLAESDSPAVALHLSSRRSVRAEHAGFLPENLLLTVPSRSSDFSALSSCTRISRSMPHNQRPLLRPGQSGPLDACPARQSLIFSASHRVNDFCSIPVTLHLMHPLTL